MKNCRLLFLLMAALLVAQSQPAVAKTVQHKRAAARTAQSDVSVTRNLDGSVEVTDKGTPAQTQGGDGTTYYVTKPGIQYRPAPAATLHYGDGVVVHRNADGSVEVTDEDSMHPAVHSLGAPVYHASRHATKSSGIKAHAKAAVKKAK